MLALIDNIKQKLYARTWWEEQKPYKDMKWLGQM